MARDPETTSVAVQRLTQRDMLSLAMRANQRVAFDYRRKRDGAEMHYVAAPYSFRFRFGRENLYATEGKHGDGQIHSFIFGRVKNVEPRPKREFFPVWPVDPESA